MNKTFNHSLNAFKYLNQCGVTYANRDNVQLNFSTMTALITLKASQAQNKAGELRQLTRDLPELEKTFKVVLCLNTKNFQWSLTKTQDAGIIQSDIKKLAEKYPLYGYTSHKLSDEIHKPANVWAREYTPEPLNFDEYLKHCEAAQAIDDKLYKINKDLASGVFSMPRDEGTRSIIQIDFSKRDFRGDDELGYKFFMNCDKFNLKYLDFIKSKIKVMPENLVRGRSHSTITQKQLTIADELGFKLDETQENIALARANQTLLKIG